MSKNISVASAKTSGWEAYHYHVILQRLLPIAAQPNLKCKDIATTLTGLANFFQQICSRTVCVKDLDKLQERIALILCKLEKICPPSFFDIMVHSTVHLPRLAKLVGPVGFRWMYPFERNLEKLSKAVRRKAQPESSIAEASSVNEALRFCSTYLCDTNTHSNQDEQKSKSSLTLFSQPAKPYGPRGSVNFSLERIVCVHSFLLRTCEELTPYAEEHEEELKKISSVDADKRHREEFTDWLKNHIEKLRETEPTMVTDELCALASGPDTRVNTYSDCIFKGVQFVIEEEDEHSITRNSGVHCVDLHEREDMDFYGALSSVLEFNYPFGHRVAIFKCKWFKTNPKTGPAYIDCNIPSLWTDMTCDDDRPYVHPYAVQQAIYINPPKKGKHIQKFQPWHFWDALKTRTNEEDMTGAKPKSCNFIWTDHVDDIDNKSFVSESGEAEMKVINSNVVPDLCDDDVGDHEKFDDMFGDDDCY